MADAADRVHRGAAEDSELHILEANPAYVYVELSRLSLLESYRGYVHQKLNEPTMHLWYYGIAWSVFPSR